MKGGVGRDTEGADRRGGWGRQDRQEEGNRVPKVRNVKEENSNLSNIKPKS